MDERTTIATRMRELSKPIDEALLMCDDREEVLMLASVMMISIKNMFDSQIGVDGRKKMFRTML
jgi:hypothetical protein